MRGNSHVRFGGRAEETGEPKGQHRASVRPNHTAVALAIANGAHAKSIQARMGHSSVSITLDRYGHLLPSLDDQIAEGLERMYRLASIERSGPPPVTVAELQPVT